jgi:acyl-CoA thioester hydrolase
MSYGRYKAAISILTKHSSIQCNLAFHKRSDGLAYSDLEKAGIFYVVAELTAKYRRPALYDETLDLTTVCTRITTARVEHTYTLKRPSSGLILCEGTSILACVDAQGKPRRMPEFMHPAE